MGVLGRIGGKRRIDRHRRGFRERYGTRPFARSRLPVWRPLEMAEVRLFIFAGQRLGRFDRRRSSDLLFRQPDPDRAIRIADLRHSRRRQQDFPA